MVVSAILTTALAPITGALFGASYGTAIRIGYEIIFPALFGKVKPNPDAQDVIKSLHTMFQATGGASAMEFGIDQGIEMAKKKTESPVIQHLINTDLGITEQQLLRAGRGGGVSQAAIDAATPTTGAQDFPDVVSFTPTGDIGDFNNLTLSQIKSHFEKLTKFQFVTNLRLMDEEATKLDKSGAKGGGATLRQYHAIIKAIFFVRFGTPDTQVVPPVTDLPTSADAVRRDFDAQFIIHWNAWQSAQKQIQPAQNLYASRQQISLSQPKSISAATSTAKARAELLRVTSLTLDFYKKIQNFLVLSKNNPLTRLLALAKEKQLPPAL